MSPERLVMTRHTRQSSAQGRIVVIGGGFGGLATAIRLQAAGYRVRLVEAQPQLGGRAGQWQSQGYTFDLGPTLITAPELLNDLWATASRSLADDLELIPLRPFYRICFEDGRSFDYGGGSAEDEAAIRQFAPADIGGYHEFLAATERLHQRAFIDLAGQPFDRFDRFLRIVPELIRLGAARSVYDYVARYFSDPHLRMVFSFHPLFIGGNPFRASAIYSIVPYLERQGGVYFVKGGTYALVTAMAKLFTSLGGEIECGRAVAEILVNGGRASGVRLADNSFIAADAVVANSDITTTYLQLLPPAYRRPLTSWRLRHYRYSMSCFLLYLGLDCSLEQLRHHTVIMPANYRQAIGAIFDDHGLPEDLAAYVHAPARTDPDLAPPGCESLYILVPVPHLGHGIDWSQAAQPFRERVLRFVSARLSLPDLTQHIFVERQTTPVDFEERLGSWLGSAFSIEPTLQQSAWFRPHNRLTELAGLYAVGAGTHPGAGLPGVLLSAAITSRLVVDDLGPAAVTNQ